MNPRQQTTVRLEKYGKVTIFSLPTRNWQYSGKQGSWMNPPNERRSGRRKLGAAPLSQGCSEARAWYFLKEKEKREGEEEKETRRELRQYSLSLEFTKSGRLRKDDTPGLVQ